MSLTQNMNRIAMKLPKITNKYKLRSQEYDNLII